MRQVAKTGVPDDVADYKTVSDTRDVDPWDPRIIRMNGGARGL